MEYWQKTLLDDLPGGEAPPNTKKTKDWGATPRSQTNFEKNINFEYIGPKNVKTGVNFGKKTYLTTYQGGEGGNNEKIPNTEKKHPEKVLLKVWPRCRVGGGGGHLGPNTM